MVLFWVSIIYAVRAVLSNFGLTAAAGAVVLAGFAAFGSVFCDLVNVDHTHPLPYREAVDVALVSPVRDGAA